MSANTPPPPLHGDAASFSASPSAIPPPVAEHSLHAQQPVPRQLKIDITADTTCPFCLLGITQLEIAIEQYLQHAPLYVDIELHPYQLRPETPEVPVSRNASSISKYGEQRWTAALHMLQEEYAAVGLELAQDAQLSSSHLGHRLTQRAYANGGPAIGYAVGMSLMRAYHLGGLSPSDHHLVARIGMDHGLFNGPEAALAWIDSDEDDGLVRDAYAEAQHNGITGVPHFVFQDMYVASGAMGVSEFAGIIETVLWAGMDGPVEGDPVEGSDEQGLERLRGPTELLSPAEEGAPGRPQLHLQPPSETIVPTLESTSDSAKAQPTTPDGARKRTDQSELHDAQAALDTAVQAARP